MDYDIDRVLEMVGDIINPQFKGWYARFMRSRGIDKFLLITDQARKGKDPTRLLSYLLKQEMDK